MRDKLKIEIVDLIEKDKEINANILKERDYSKTLEEKIISLKDKSILSQKEAEKSSAEIIKFKAEVKNLKTALTQMNLKLSQLQALFDKQKEEDEGGEPRIARVEEWNERDFIDEGEEDEAPIDDVPIVAHVAHHGTSG